ncbi:MAG: hypothetical protein Q7T71_20445 [Herbiconiux sp.]|nr:hypothetical protein [Herbiconiux sp.]
MGHSSGSTRQLIPTRAARFAIGALLALGGVVALAGCVAPGPGDLESLSVYQRDQGSDDILPDTIDEGVALSVDPASTRLLGEHDGRTFFAASGVAEGASACLVIVGATSADSVAGCGSALPVQIGPTGGDLYALAPRMPDGWTELTDDLWYLESGTPTP